MAAVRSRSPSDSQRMLSATAEPAPATGPPWVLGAYTGWFGCLNVYRMGPSCEYEFCSERYGKFTGRSAKFAPIR